MTKWIPLAFSMMVAVTTSCASQQQLLNQKQGGAVETVLQRARFEMNCPSATGTVLSQDYIQPAVRGPWVSGLQRAEYTIGVEGCGQRHTYVVMCQVGTDTCFAANPNRRYVLEH
jgi:hypothetical protein